MRKLCELVAKHLPSVTISIPDPVTKVKEPYLTRHYIFGKDRKWGNIYLHKFHSSDKGLELHNHPWKWALCLIVAGGYREEFRVGDEVESRRVKPTSFNYITDKKFHRVDLLEQDGWSIVFTGPRTQEWGFWNRYTKQFTHWKNNPDAIE